MPNLPEKIKTHLKALPDSPGIYQFKNEHDTILYIGKAKNLKKRVSSYFMGTNKDIKTHLMVRQVQDIETMTTETESEALILENQLVKHHKPRYNIRLKDDKTYPYIKVTVQDPFPRIIITRHKQNDGARYYGPYPSLGSSRKFRRFLYDLFPIRDCIQKIDLKTQQPKCINLDIGKCIGPCIYKDIKPEYDTLVKNLELLLAGKNKKLISTLKTQMKELANKQAFEQAAKMRDRIQKVEQLMESQTVDLSLNTSFTLLTVTENQGYFYLFTQIFHEGKRMNQYGHYAQKQVDLNQNDFLEQALPTLLEKIPHFPPDILCIEPIKPILETLQRDYPDHVTFNTLSVPQRGLKKDLLTIATKQAKGAISHLHLTTIRPTDTAQKTLTALQKKLNLDHLPNRIVGFDISHLSGTNIVASAVCFIAGVPSKSDYKKFNIKTKFKNQSDDPGAMHEVVYRYLNLCLRNQDPLPDLLLIDGGRTQLAAAKHALERLNITLPHISLAKREEEVYFEPDTPPLKWDADFPGRQLLQHVRDEAHRFAVTFQRKKRQV